MSREHNTITLQGSMPTKEANAAAEVFPGNAIALDSAGDAVLQATVLEPRIGVATEDGKGGGTIEDSYAVGERVTYKVPRRGDVMNVRVGAGAAAIALQAPVALAAGKFVVHGGDVAVQTVIGYALEAVDNSGGAEDVFIAVEFA